MSDGCGDRQIEMGESRLASRWVVRRPRTRYTGGYNAGCGVSLVGAAHGARKLGAVMWRKLRSRAGEVSSCVLVFVAGIWEPSADICIGQLTSWTVERYPTLPKVVNEKAMPRKQLAPFN